MAPVPDKRTDPDDAVAAIEDGMTVGIGGWGARRKPMALVRALLRSGVRDLTVVTYGGPDVGWLCAAGRVRRVISGFVSLDSIPLEPHYRAARQSGAIEVAEWDEGMLLLGLQAAAWRLPFLPTRAGLGSDVPLVHPGLRTVRSPYPSPPAAPPAGGGDGGPPAGAAGVSHGEHEELLAVPPLELDVALIHVHRADRAGNAALTGPDPYMDDLYAMAARTTLLSCEEVVDTGGLARHAPLQAQLISRLYVSAVVEAPGGAHPTECPPDYRRDEDFQRRYVEAAADPGTWAEFASRWLEHPGEDAYQQAVAADRSGRGDDAPERSGT